MTTLHPKVLSTNGGRRVESDPGPPVDATSAMLTRPTILVGAETLLGRVLVDHVASLLSNATFCGCVYDNRSRSIAEGSN